MKTEAALPSENSSVSVYQQLYPSEELQHFYSKRESEEDKSQMLGRTDSAMTSGSQALQHIEETLKLRERRTKERTHNGEAIEGEMKVTEQINVITDGCMEVSTDIQHSSNDLNCRRYVQPYHIKKSPMIRRVPIHPFLACSPMQPMQSYTAITISVVSIFTGFLLVQMIYI